MAKVKYDQEEVLTGLLEVFRSVGYDGASLEELAKASGMRKSSLYHRFPGGKAQMAEEVLAFVGNWNKQNITDVFYSELTPDNKLKKVLKNIHLLYNGGEKICLLRSVSLIKGLELFDTSINKLFEDLITGFTHLGTELGMKKTDARFKAEETIIRIQGALVVCKGLNRPSIFKRTLKSIEESYI